MSGSVSESRAAGPSKRSASLSNIICVGENDLRGKLTESVDKNMSDN